MNVSTYACRITWNDGDKYIRVATEHAVKIFAEGVRALALRDGYLGGGVWRIPATPGNLHQLMCLAGEHYPGSAIYTGNGVPSPILPPFVRCRKCGARYDKGHEREHERECVGEVKQEGLF
jgi:hypothetical protein